MPKINRDFTATFNGKTYRGSAGDDLGDVPPALLSSLKEAQIVVDDPAPKKKGKQDD